MSSSSSSTPALSPEEGKGLVDQTNGCDKCDCADNPIRFFNGEVVFSEQDLSGPVSGFGHGRSFSNKLSGNYAGPNGNNWLMPNWPYLVEESSTVYVFVRGQERVWFDKSGSTYTARYSASVTYTLTASGSLLVLEKRTSRGVETIKFHDFTQSTAPKGMLNIHLDAYGNKTEASYTAASDNWIKELRYTVLVSGSPDAEQYKIVYAYNGEGAHTDRIDTATLQKTTNGGTNWSNIRRAAYDYYGASEPYGNQNDLKLVTVQNWNGSSWDPVSKSYYRYYLTTETNGFDGALKYVVSPIAWAEMVADSLNPETADVAGYADHYFEYDADQKVVKEIARNCAGCGGGGGTGSAGETFTRTANGNGGYADGYNNWKWKVVLTKANGNIETVYTNYLGQVLLRELKESAMSSRKWVTVKQFGQTAGADAGKVVQTASPAAVTSYSDLANDLDIVLKSGAGLITYTMYGSSTTASGETLGDAAGYVKTVKISEGSGGSQFLQRDLLYKTSTNSTGQKTIVIGKQTLYKPETTGTPTPVSTDLIVTSYEYLWHSSPETAVKQIKTILPDTGSQNGTDDSETLQYFDANGRMTFSQDARTVVTQHTYNPVTGRMTKTQVDVNTGLPSGWSGAGNTNLTTDYNYDDLGRQIEVLGPSHPADINGTAQTIRHAAWTVYVEAVLGDQTWTGQGYRISTTDYLIDPVRITLTDKNGRPTDQIAAKRTTGSGALSDSDEFLYSGWSRWTVSTYDTTGRLDYQRVYHDLPSQTGSPSFPATSPSALDPGTAGPGGGLGGNYVETFYGYDNATNLRVRVKSPDGTITRSVYDPINRPIETWVGTDDTGATAADPTGGGATGNNMVEVSCNVYDNGNDQGDSFLTSTTQDVDGNAGNDRTTTFTYDFRGRRLTVNGEVDLFVKNTYDNLGRVTLVERYDTDDSSSANLIGKQETSFDDRGRVYQTKRYEVDPTTGTPGTYLTGQNWHDANGNVTTSIAPGSGAVWTKSVFDNIGRQTRSYTGYDDGSATNGVVIVQDSVPVYNDASQVTRTESKALNTGVGKTTQTYRTSYLAFLYDGIGRTLAQVNYGITAPGSWPTVVPTRSDTVLVSSTTYNADTGEATSTTDPGGIETRRTFDDMGRVTSQIDNYQASPSGDDENRTTEYTYTADSQQRTLTAVMDPTSNNQVTTYVYGVDVSKGSALAANNLLYAIQYPTDTSTSRIELKYNRQGQVTEREDQNGTVHLYTYDKLGRPVADVANTLGTGIDNAVRRLTTSYNNRGLPEYLTSWSTTTGSSGGDIVNQVKLDYNDFGQLTSDWQEHEGAVETSGGNASLRVQYAYAPGSSGGTPTNQVRPTSMVYPNSRQLEYGYGGDSGITNLNDKLNRVSQLQESSGATTWASYQHLGLGTKVFADYEQAGFYLDLWGSSTGSYVGLDAFSRISAIDWYDYANTSSDLVYLTYGYNRNSLPTRRVDGIGTSYSETYGRDGLDRLNDYTRGVYSGGSIITPNFRQYWETLDQVANWDSFKQDDNGGGSSWDLQQTRTHNKSNEITGISNTTGGFWDVPTYDAAGNTTLISRGDDAQTERLVFYDAWNRVARIEIDDSPAEFVAEYAYDARGFRIVRKLYTAGTHDATWHDYFTANWQCIEEREQDPSTEDPAELRTQYLWGLRYIDDLIQRKRDTDGNGTLDETLYALSDRQFNVVALADTSGDPVQRILYTPYGTPTFLTAGYGASSNVYGLQHQFQGLRTDAETGLIENRRRVLHPLLGRFLQRDPWMKDESDISPQVGDGYPDGMNTYAAYHVMTGGEDSFGTAVTARMIYACITVNWSGCNVCAGWCTCIWKAGKGLADQLLFEVTLTTEIEETCVLACVASNDNAGQQKNMSGITAGSLTAIMGSIVTCDCK